MKLSDISFGEIDAKNEIIKQMRSNSDDFFDSFTIPKNINIGKILDGQISFIYRLKGTGKTALLRYIKNRIDGHGDISSLILFKSHVSEDERQELSKSSGYEIISTENGPTFHQDFKEAWKWFVFRRLARALYDAGVENDSVKKLYYLTDTDSGKLFQSIGALFSRISRGSINLSGEAFGVAAELGIDVSNTDGAKWGRLTDINRVCAGLLPNINLGKKVYILFDELELYHETDEQFDRDRRILRDLIYAINQINTEISENNIPIYLCSTLRTEVLHSVLELGHEIGRDIDDYGARLDWNGGRESVAHPLMALMQRKIAQSTGLDEKDVWKKFFPERINNKEFYRFILQSSYFRPRDIVRLLKVARSHDAQVSSFTTEHFDATALEYSRQTWLEVTEELLAIYSPNEMKSIEKLFLSFGTHFFLDEIEKRSDVTFKNERAVQALVKKHGINKILSDLYRIGVVGNDFIVNDRVGRTRQRNRWIFRGNSTLNDRERMTFHKSLWKHLSLVETHYGDFKETA